jgi:glycosyltransferase involved in cell wall biosynthesis
VDSLRKTGVEVTKIPMYLPLFSDEHDLADVPVFYGAISIYLKQVMPVFRKAPHWVDKVFNSGPALKFAAHMSGSTNPKGLEEMTLSMLRGEQGKQRVELDHLVHWMKEHGKPDVVHLSNALLLGLAHRIREALDPIIVCSLQDEDQWVDAMDEEYQAQTWQLMAERAVDVDAFFPVSTYFHDRMLEEMRIPSGKMHTVHIGIDPALYTFRNSAEKAPVIGFMSRICEENGFEILVDAFSMLKNRPGMENVQLMVTGGGTGQDKSFIRRMKRKLHIAGVESHVVFYKDFEGAARQDFLQNISVLSVPVLKGEAFGLYLLEAMASGIPVVQPALGAFPEIVGLSGGGLIYGSNTPDALADKLEELLVDREKLALLSDQGRKGVEKHFNIQHQAAKMKEVYQQINSQKNSRHATQG